MLLKLCHMCVPLVRWYISLIDAVEISLIGAPLSPPLSLLCLLFRLPGREVVVLVIISPSGFLCGCGLVTQAAISSLSAGERSGEILTRRGGLLSSGSWSTSAITCNNDRVLTIIQKTKEVNTKSSIVQPTVQLFLPLSSARDQYR